MRYSHVGTCGDSRLRLSTPSAVEGEASALKPPQTGRAHEEVLSTTAEERRFSAASDLVLTGGDGELALKACGETTRRGDVGPR
jgi:hypothetical protein